MLIIMPTVAELLDLAEYSFKEWGIWIIPVSAFLENSIILGFIFPGVTAIFFAGFVARSTGESLAYIIILATVGSFLGDNFDYFLGRRGGRVLENKPLYAKSVARVEPFLKKHGIWAIFVGRFSGWSRAWVALASGIIGFTYWKFAVVSALSAFFWTSIWIIGGYILGENRELIEEYLGRATLVSWLIFLAIVVFYFRTRIKLLLEIIAYTSKKHGKKIKSKITNGRF